MSKILVNQTAADIDLADTGVTVLASGSYTIPPQNYPVFAASADVIVALSNATLILNDGGNDITNISDAVDIIKGWCPAAAAAEETPFFFDYSDNLIGDAPTSVIFYAVPAGQILFIRRLEIACRIESVTQVIKNGEIIADLRTGAAQPSSSFSWYPAREFVEGDTVEVILTKRPGTADVSIGAHIMGVTTTT